MISPNHPRANSLLIREQLIAGVKAGTTSYNGLLAHGRAEAFDYLIGEQTQKFAKDAIEVAAQLLVAAQHPVLSINGNIAALCSNEYIKIAQLLHCPIEINLFHSSLQRKRAIKKYLASFGFKNILGVDEDLVTLQGIASERRWVSPTGIAKADVVLVPLEDGDRCEALIKSGKTVITIDLNPLSRTAQMATVTIVDNIIRALPILITKVKDYQWKPRLKTAGVLKKYNNKKVLSEALQHINKRLKNLTI